MLRTAGVPKNIALIGTLNSKLNATWGKTIKDLVAQVEATIDGRISGTTNRPAGVIPLNAVVHGNYSNALQQIAMTKSYVRTPQTALTMNGVMSKHSNLAVKLQSNDLHEIETAADLFRPSALGQTVQPLGLAGMATFNGTLRGSTTAPHLPGQLTASNVQVHGTSSRVVRTGVDLSPSLAKFQNARARASVSGAHLFGCQHRAQ